MHCVLLDKTDHLFPRYNKLVGKRGPSSTNCVVEWRNALPEQTRQLKGTQEARTATPTTVATGTGSHLYSLPSPKPKHGVVLVHPPTRGARRRGGRERRPPWQPDHLSAAYSHFFVSLQWQVGQLLLRSLHFRLVSLSCSATVVAAQAWLAGERGA